MCPFTPHVPWKQEVFNVQGIGCCCLLRLIQVICLLFMSIEIKATVFFTPIIWRHLVWWAFRNWHSWNYVEHCVLLWFFQEDNPTVLLICRSKLVLYYLSNYFVIVVKHSIALKNFPTRFKQRIYSVYMLANNFVMTSSTEIIYIANTMKKIHISTTLFIEFNSTHYDDNNYVFEIFFKQYTWTSVYNIGHPSLIQ